MPVLDRHQSITADWTDENCLEVVTYFKDYFHEIKTFITFDCTSRKITRAEAQMLTVPFDLCLEVCTKMNGLVGLEVKTGIFKSINEIVGTSRGCSHLVDMSVDSVKAFAQAVTYCLMPKGLNFEEKWEKIKEANIGVCHTYSNLDKEHKFIGNRDIIESL